MRVASRNFLTICLMDILTRLKRRGLTPQAPEALVGFFLYSGLQSTSYKGTAAEISIDPWHWHPAISLEATVWGA